MNKKTVSAIGLSAALMLSGCSASDGAQPATEESSAASSTPTEAVAPTSPAPVGIIADEKTFQLEVDQTPERLGEDFASSLQFIYNYGFDESIQAYVDSQGSLDPEEVAEATSDKAVFELEKLLHDDYKSDPLLTDFVERIRQTNITHTYLHLITDPNPDVAAPNTTERLIIDEEFVKTAITDDSSIDELKVSVSGRSVPRNLDATNIRNQDQYKLIGEGNDWIAYLALEKSSDGKNWIVANGRIETGPLTK